MSWPWRVAYKITWALTAAGIVRPHEWLLKRLWLKVDSKPEASLARTQYPD